MKQEHKKEQDYIDNEAIYSVKSMSTGKILLLGLQHTVAVFGSTVLVPLITGLDISTTLLMTGLGTLLFHWITKGKVPAFLGSSFAFLGGYAAVAPMFYDNPNTEMLAYANGGVLVAGFAYLILAGLIKYFGVRKIIHFFPPVVTGPIIISIGLMLAPSAIANCQQNWMLAFITLAILIICNIWGKGLVKIIPIVIGMLISYFIALLTGQIDFMAFSSISNFALPINPELFAKFDLSAIITILPISLATMMEHIGDLSAISATTGHNYFLDPGLHRTLIGDGLATSLAALFGGPANTTYGGNTGILVLTKIYDPIIMQLAAVFVIILSFFPIVAQLINSIPTAIVGGISFVLYGMISSNGIRHIVENHVDLTKSRNLIIIAVILICALGLNETGGIVFKCLGTSITLSSLSVAAIAGIILNIILPGNDYALKNADKEIVHKTPEE